MNTIVMMVLIAVVPLFTAVADVHRSTTGISERHHRSHDTYAVPRAMLTTLVATIVFMGVLGLMVGWLCMMDAFVERTDVVLGFFLMFLIVMYVVWVMLNRYTVITYADHLVVVPFLGSTRSIDYASITAMTWTGALTTHGERSLRIYAAGQKGYALVWRTLDVERILMKIDRYDVLESPWT